MASGASEEYSELRNDEENTYSSKPETQKFDYAEGKIRLGLPQTFLLETSYPYIYVSVTIVPVLWLSSHCDIWLSQGSLCFTTGDRWPLYGAEVGSNDVPNKGIYSIFNVQ